MLILKFPHADLIRGPQLLCPSELYSHVPPEKYTFVTNPATLHPSQMKAFLATPKTMRVII